MTLTQILASLLSLAALASYINHRILRLPPTIGMMAIVMALSLLAVLAGNLGLIELQELSIQVESIDFKSTLLDGMLAFLLFAGALHVNFDDLRRQALPIAVLSTVGVAIATFLIGIIFWLVAGWLGFELPLIYGLLFGALISPTDPIAALGILKQANAPESLKTKITGESLFNDGIGVVIFLTILAIAAGDHQPNAGEITLFLLEEAVGGAIVGMILGWVFYRLIRSVNKYPVEVLLTLALASGGYALAQAIHVSAPIAIVVAGLIIGNHGRSFAMSETTREHLDSFWELVDEILNAVLFVLIGLEVLILELQPAYLILGIIAIVIVLFGRFISIGTTVTAMKTRRTFSKGAIRILTWGGLRGGISIALALSLPVGPERDLILVSAYIVVVFSILVQGLTLGRLIRAASR